MQISKDYILIEDSTGKKALLKNKNKKNKILAVFVHGFTGNYLSTWGDFPELLMQDPRLLNFDFLYWGYSSNLVIPKEDYILDNVKQLFTQFLSKHKTNQHIEVVAHGLQTELNYLEGYDEISLIGHSLGGLVIRSYIIQNLRENRLDNLERIKKINQIILFGTPNEGLDIANNKLLNGFNNQIHDLGSYNEFIKTLREDWVELVFKNKSLDLSTLMVAGEDDYFVPFEQVSKYFRDSTEITQGNHETMIKPNSINDTTYKIVANNLLKVAKTSERINNSSILTQSAIDYGNLKKIMDKIRKLIADRGLDDESWSQTVPAQYFLVNLARLLDLTNNLDYLYLLDTFLKSFYMTVDNKLILSKGRDLDTPEEMDAIRNCMIEEDKRDDYYSKYKKNAAQNIDMDILKYNYHYGLMAQISNGIEFPDSLTLKWIQKLSIDRLIYAYDKIPTDDHGGWYPQRTPWVTARALIGLKNSGYAERDDKAHIEELSLKAIEYLLRSIYKESYWRSGVGDWVTNWEATALCLQAIDDWGQIRENQSKIRHVLQYVLVHEYEWRIDPPAFDSKKNSNLTLASVTVLCTILLVIHKNFQKEFDIDYRKYVEYLFDIINKISNSNTMTIMHYCTIPQITFFIARLIATLDKSLKKSVKTDSDINKLFPYPAYDKS